MGQKLLTRQNSILSVSNEAEIYSLIGFHHDGDFVKQDLQESKPTDLLQSRLTGWLNRPGIEVNSVTYASLLRECGNGKALSAGKLIHVHIINKGHGRNGFLGNLLIQMYGRCGALEDARMVFDNIHQTDIFSWNLLIGAYVQNNRGAQAVELFRRMQLESSIPNKHTFLSILSACASRTALARGKKVHAHIVSSGLESDIILGTAVVNMYGKCHNMEAAREMFDSMPTRNVISWNSMISAYAQHGEGRMALQLFQKMLLEGLRPSRVTFISVLDACASEAALAEGKLMHSYVSRSGFELDVVVGTALVNMYGKCGNLEEAEKMFDKMHERNIVTWNAMIAVSAQHAESMKAFQLLEEMELTGVMPNKSTFVSILSACTSSEDLLEGKHIHSRTIIGGLEHDVILGTALVCMYGKCGSLKDARGTFDVLPTHDLVSWTAIIALYAQHGNGKEALLLFQKMPPKVVLLDNVTFVSILDACATQGALAEGREMHACILGSDFESDVVVATALVNMYGKCSKLEDACSVFNRIPQRDVVSFNAMIAVYAQHGEAKKAILLFHQMKPGGIIPDDVTFVCILTACSHAGLVDDGSSFFCSMRSEHGIFPTTDHYNCMLDLLGRAGHIDDGEKVISSMPFQPSATSWMTLLSACRMHFDAECGESVASHVFEMEPEYGAPYVLLSNLYAAAGRSDDAEKLREMMKGNIWTVLPGCSSMEVEGAVHDFFVHQNIIARSEKALADYNIYLAG